MLFSFPAQPPSIQSVLGELNGSERLEIQYIKCRSGRWGRISKISKIYKKEQ